MTAIIVSLATPILGGMISIAIWQAKRNSAQVTDGLKNLHSCVHEVSQKVDEVQLDIAKNYCTKEELKDHVDKEDDWHDKFSKDLTEIKDTQWQIRLDQLEIKGKTDKM